MLAAAFLAGEWELDAMTRAGAARRRAAGVAARGSRWRSSRPTTAAARPPARARRLRRDRDRGAAAARRGCRRACCGSRRFTPRWAAALAGAADRHGGRPGGACSELDPGQLAWLADVRGLERAVRDERLRNYRYVRVRARGPARRG